MLQRKSFIDAIQSKKTPHSTKNTGPIHKFLILSDLHNSFNNPRHTISRHSIFPYTIYRYLKSQEFYRTR